jgi:hypothetical protein
LGPLPTRKRKVNVEDTGFDEGSVKQKALNTKRKRVNYFLKTKVKVEDTGLDEGTVEQEWEIPRKRVKTEVVDSGVVSSKGTLSRMKLLKVEQW